MKQLLTEDQKKRMWRDAAIRKTFRELIECNSAKTAAHEFLAKKYKLTTTQIRNIIAKKEVNNG